VTCRCLARREQDDRALAALRLLPAAQEQIDLLAAPDERRRAGAQRLEPALGGARAQRLPCRDGLGEAFVAETGSLARTREVIV
jgi:hypothetical protein